MIIKNCEYASWLYYDWNERNRGLTVLRNGECNYVRSFIYQEELRYEHAFSSRFSNLTVLRTPRWCSIFCNRVDASWALVCIVTVVKKEGQTLRKKQPTADISEMWTQNWYLDPLILHSYNLLLRRLLLLLLLLSQCLLLLHLLLS